MLKCSENFITLANTQQAQNLMRKYVVNSVHACRAHENDDDGDG